MMNWIISFCVPLDSLALLLHAECDRSLTSMYVFFLDLLLDSVATSSACWKLVMNFQLRGLQLQNHHYRTASRVAGGGGGGTHKF